MAALLSNIAFAELLFFGMEPQMNDQRLIIRGSLAIYDHDLEEKFIQSGGPGGQNVNKLATGVQLRYNPRRAATLPLDVIERAERLAGSRLTSEGDIVIQATRFRSQEKNRNDARERLVALFVEAAKPPPPKRKRTRPTLASKRRRLDAKKQRGTIKKMRGSVGLD